MSVDTSNETAAPPPDDDTHAGEYVLGVLDELARRRAQNRIRSDAGFARLVGDWERRFAPWLLRAAPATPSPRVWQEIRDRLGWRGRDTARDGLWNNVAFWRAAAGLALVAGIAVVAFDRARTPPATTASEQAERPVTVLARGDGTPGWIARIDATRGEVLMMPIPAAVDPSGLVNELWIIPVGGKPQSLGLLSHEKAQTIAVPDALRASFAAGATLAVTLEERAGIPHAAPSSQPIAVGSIRTI